ncbi:MAG: hypothetical protein ACRDKJ_13000 [Actinomycetota bacterium]
MSARLCCSYLRVYRPFEGLSQPERALVEHVRGRVGSLSSRPTRHSLGLLAPQECRELYEKTVDGSTFVCLGHNQLRRLLGLVAFERSLPDAVVPFFFSEQEIATARAELERIQRAHPDVHPPVVQSVWHVPLRWFVCFDDGERRIEQDGDHPTIRYETRIATARDRVGHALQTLTGGIVHPVIVGMIYELREWLATFDPSALLELDYASVAAMFDPDEIADDHSAADVWSAIHALGEGDGMKAGLFYQRANERWTRARQRESLN